MKVSRVRLRNLERRVPTPFEPLVIDRVWRCRSAVKWRCTTGSTYLRRLSAGSPGSSQAIEHLRR
jgi:hypothetical protein